MPPDLNNLNLPTRSDTPTAEYGQVMFALGKMSGDIGAIRDHQAAQNGKVFKSEAEIIELNKWRAAQGGEGVGKRAVWNFLYVLAGLALGALTVYFSVRH